MASFHSVQTDPYSLSGAGAILGSTSITLQSLLSIDGVALAMSDFGAIGYGTLDPGNGALEEQISFTTLVQNSNGTATLGGIKSVLFVSPYTETSGLAKTHAGSTPFVISNTSGFYNKFAIKQNDETIDGQWTFLNTPIVPGVVSDASTTVKGVSKTSVAPADAANPIVVGTNDNRVLIGYAVDSVGTDAYAITPSPAIPAYAAGQVFTFKAGTANTGAATLSVSGLSAIAIKKNATQALETGDILAGQIVALEYDGINMQMVTATANSTGTPTTNVQTFNASGTWTKPASIQFTMARVQNWAGGGPGATDGGGATTGGGGGGGGYNEITLPLSSLGATETVTIPAAATPGNPGGTVTFGSWVSAFGGAPGVSSSTGTQRGGGGGGPLAAGGSATAGTAEGTAGSPGSPLAGPGGSGNGLYSGGGGSQANPGGNAYWGGGGGSGSGTGQTGGTSVMGGKGGDVGQNGTAPSGGGGAQKDDGTGSAGAGAIGRVIVTVW